MIKISGTTGIDMGGNAVSNASQIDGVVVNENGINVANQTELELKANTADINVPNSSLVKTALNANGDAPIYACRAWVNFNGTGTVAIRASGNVSSITDNGTGNYTVNFATAMPDDNYNMVYGVSIANDTYNIIQETVAARFVNSVAVYTGTKGRSTSAGGLQDANIVSISIFR